MTWGVISSVLLMIMFVMYRNKKTHQYTRIPGSVDQAPEHPPPSFSMTPSPTPPHKILNVAPSPSLPSPVPTAVIEMEEPIARRTRSHTKRKLLEEETFNC